MKTAKSRTRTRAGTRTAQAVGVVPSNAVAGNDKLSSGNNGSDIVSSLREILATPDVPAAAKVNAARTLAELEGQLGRHQSAPDRGTTSPLSTLSRGELMGELERLRTLFGLGLVR